MLLLKILIVLWGLAVVANIIVMIVAAKKADTYHIEYPIDYWSKVKHDAEQNIEDK